MKVDVKDTSHQKQQGFGFIPKPLYNFRTGNETA